MSSPGGSESADGPTLAAKAGSGRRVGGPANIQRKPTLRRAFRLCWKHPRGRPLMTMELDEASRAALRGATVGRRRRRSSRRPRMSGVAGGRGLLMIIRTRAGNTVPQYRRGAGYSNMYGAGGGRGGVRSGRRDLAGSRRLKRRDLNIYGYLQCLCRAWYEQETKFSRSERGMGERSEAQRWCRQRRWRRAAREPHDARDCFAVRCRPVVVAPVVALFIGWCCRL